MLIVGSVNKHYYDHVQTVYGWDTATVSLYANWGSIAFLAFMVPILYLQVIIHKYNPTTPNLNVKDFNLRATVLLSSGLVALATSIRCAFLVFPGINDR